MQVNELSREKNFILREYVFDSAEVARFEDEAARYLNSLKMRVEGFRPGKVPKQVFKIRLRDDFYNVYVAQMAEKVVVDSIRMEGDLELLLPVQILSWNFDSEGGKIVAEIHTKPKIEVDIAKFKFFKPKMERLVERIAQLLREADLEKFVVLEPKDGPAEVGDLVVLDERVLLDQRVLRERNDVEHRISSSSRDELDTQLVGKVEGDEVQFERTFNKPSEGKNVVYTYQLKVKKVYRRKVPELNDDLVKDFGIPGVESVKDYEDHLLRKASDEAASQLKNSLSAQLARLVAEHTEVEISNETVRRYVDSLIQRLIEEGRYEDYRKMYGDEEEMREALASSVVRHLKRTLGLEKLFDDFKINVQEEEIREELRAVSLATGTSLDRLEAIVRRDESLLDDWITNLKTAKLVDALMDKVQVEELNGNESGVHSSEVELEDVNDANAPSEQGD